MSLRRTLDVMGATVERASSFPLSASCLVNRAELLSLVERARAELPVELDEAAALLVAHQDVINRAEAEAQLVLASARARADEMVQDSALVATARGRSEQILDAARTEAARLLREADQYCDRRLAEFEDDLERAMAQVRRGRDRLRERSDLASMDTLQAHGTDGADGAVEPYLDISDVEVEYIEEFVEPGVFDRMDDGTGQAADELVEATVEEEREEELEEELEPAPERQPVAVGAQREHRIVDLAGMERAEAERAGLGQGRNLQ